MSLNSFEIEVRNNNQICFRSGSRTISQAMEIHIDCFKKYLSNFETNRTSIRGNFMLHFYSDEYIENLKRKFRTEKELSEVVINIFQIYTKGHMSITLKHSLNNVL